MTTMRAKLLVQCITKTSDESEVVQFCGVPASEYPEDGSDEDNTFAKFSPSVNLEITIANPNLIGKLVQGEKYYVDFTLAV